MGDVAGVSPALIHHSAFCTLHWIPMNLHQKYAELTTRRHFLRQCKLGLGGVALASMMGRDLRADLSPSAALNSTHPLAVKPPHFAPKAKRVIYLHMSGGPPQHDLFD